MTDLTLIQQTEQSLAAIKHFASQSNNGHLLDHLEQLETALRTLATRGGAITVGDISGSTAVAIGHDINIIISNQALPPAVRQPLESVQRQWAASHLEVRQVVEQSQGGHIFLSYTRADMEAALRIRRALEQAGHLVWQDLTAIKGGEEWIKSIETGVERSYALVTVVSETSQKSEWVQIEYLHAKRRGKLIIPIQVDASEIPTILLATNVVRGYPDLDAGIGQLLASLPAPAETRSEAPTPERRTLELRYLDSLLLEHSVWQDIYTPMAGVGQLRVPREQAALGVQMRTTPTTIDVGYLGEKFDRIRPAQTYPEQAKPRHYQADITPALEEMRQLVILGDPGAGKTTTLWKILSDHALEAKEDPRAPLPVLVRLGSLGGAGLQQGIKSQLGFLGAYYEDLLRENRLLFLLDGLNEMTAAHREANLREIRDLLAHCRRENLLMACRQSASTNQLSLDLPGRVIIQPLDPLRIKHFVNAYINESGKGNELFWQLAGGIEVEKVWQKWEQAGVSLDFFFTSEDIPRKSPNVYSLTSEQDDKVWRVNVRNRQRSMMALAANPYMLYMITKVFTQAGELPPNRGLLFQNFIDYLLEKREQLMQTQASELKDHLAKLAYTMQVKGEGTAFSSVQVKKSLKDEQVLYHACSASLLAVDNDQVRFTHQLLQEYFAAHRLQNLIESTKAETLFPVEKWWEPQGWEETLTILAGLYSDDCTPVVEWLADAQPEMAARCIAESGAYYPRGKLAGLRERWMPRLTDLKRNPSPRARAAVGRALGRLRLGDAPLDNRKGVSVISVAGMVLPDLDWVEILAGDFIYQEKEKRSERLFYMARYPVTFAQFQIFLDDPQGFANPDWWQGLSADDDHRLVPGEQAFKFSNHPREKVSWYDAVAFCRWLTEQTRQYPELLPGTLAGQAGCVISLPTEWEWEKAARGPHGLDYPYGKTFDSSKGNTDEIGIGQASAVGIFPLGASPYGVLDLSGNVWEWCLNEYDNPQNIGLAGSNLRVVRGGSWRYYQGYARATFRYRNGPSFRNSSIGFRIVVRTPSL